MTKLLASLFFLINVSMGCRGGEPVTITEVDYQLFTIHKTSNKNYVVYSVKTDGKCGIQNIWAYWVMDEEGGSTEELLNIEEDYYGVQSFEKDGTSATFRVAALDDRVVDATTVLVTDVDENISCYFEGYGDINKEYSHISHILIDNVGFDVHWIDVIGERMSAPFGEVKERIIPPD